MVRAAILADIHINLEAFQAVLQDVERRGGVDEVWCLGDVVGYGPDPQECIALLRKGLYECIAGNHDWAATGKIDTSLFNPYAEAATQWTRQQLAEEEVGFLNQLPLQVCKDDFTLVHGSPRDPIWEYVLSEAVALASLEHFETPYCLVGHSHIPFICQLDESSVRCVFREFPEEKPVKLQGERLIINPGGVGQPRDGIPTSSYAIYDSSEGTICRYRVSYDIPKTQEKMRKAGLPEQLITRLSYGR
ncbi:MAG: metallophosphoesterase family protein [Dehalococcoidia bacterium]